MKSNTKIYISLIVITSILLAAFIQFYLRPFYSGSNLFYRLLLGSLPNFFYVLGFSFIYPLFSYSIPFKKYIVTVFFITLGTIAYEIEQIWTARTFDYIDIVASISAAIISIILYKKLFSNRIEKLSNIIS